MRRQASSNLVWRFSVPLETWERYQMSEVATAQPWPTPREAASTANAGLMFGGIMRRDAASTHVAECGATAQNVQPSPYPGYGGARIWSGLWRWQDNAGSVFYH